MDHEESEDEDRLRELRDFYDYLLEQRQGNQFSSDEEAPQEGEEDDEAAGTPTPRPVSLSLEKSSILFRQ